MTQVFKQHVLHVIHGDFFYIFLIHKNVKLLQKCFFGSLTKLVPTHCKTNY
jgi:hypothetical protein